MHSERMYRLDFIICKCWYYISSQRMCKCIQYLKHLINNLDSIENMTDWSRWVVTEIKIIFTFIYTQFALKASAKMLYVQTDSVSCSPPRFTWHKYDFSVALLSRSCLLWKTTPCAIIARVYKRSVGLLRHQRDYSTLEINMQQECNNSSSRSHYDTTAQTYAKMVQVLMS